MNQPQGFSDGTPQQPEQNSDPWGAPPSSDESWRSAPPPQSAPTQAGQSAPPQADPWGQGASAPFDAHGTYAQPSSYPQTNDFGQMSQYSQPFGSPQLDQPPSKQGMIGLILAVVALLISLVLSVVSGLAYAEIVSVIGLEGVENLQGNTANLPPGLESTVMSAGFAVLGQLLPTCIGIAALIVSAISLSKPNQKKFGVPGLVISIVAPIISFVVFMAIMMSGMPS